MLDRPDHRGVDHKLTREVLLPLEPGNGNGVVGCVYFECAVKVCFGKIVDLLAADLFYCANDSNIIQLDGKKIVMTQ